MTAIKITHATLEHDATAAVQSLIRLNIDSCHAWESGAEQASDPAVRDLFLKIALLRRQFAAELQALLRSAGIAPVESGSLDAAFHRWWFTLKSALSGEDFQDILDESSRYEDDILRRYELLHRQLGSPGFEDVVSRQFCQVKAIHQGVRVWKDAGAAAL